MFRSLVSRALGAGLTVNPAKRPIQPIRSVGWRGLTCLLLLWGGQAAVAADLVPTDYPRLVAEARAQTRRQDWPEVARLLAQAVELNPAEAQTWFELGLARARARQFAEAIPAFERAHALGGGFSWEPLSVVGRAEALLHAAGCEAQLGHRDAALARVEQALAAGLRRPARLLVDAKLQPLRGDPRLRELAGALDRQGLSREAGYRADLAFLAREVFRLHPAPYRFTSREEFDREIAALDSELPQLGDEAAATRFQRLLVRLGDGHTGLWLREAHVAPVRLFHFEEGVFITHTRPDRRRLIGSQVIEIGGRPVAEVLAAFEPIVARDNAMTIREVAPAMMNVADFHVGLGLQSDTSGLALTLELPQGGGRETLTIPTELRAENENGDAPRREWATLAHAASEPRLARRHPDEILWFEPTAEGRVVYAAIRGMGADGQESFADFCQALFDYLADHPEVERLVLDFRLNGGGNTFLNRPLIRGLISSRLNRPGGLVVLIGRVTFSAAQNTVTEIERHTAALFLGEPTGSSPNFIGETVRFPLPYSRHLVSISDLSWGSSTPLDRRTWIEPDLYFPPRAADYLADRDPALEAALTWQPEATAETPVAPSSAAGP